MKNFDYRGFSKSFALDAALTLTLALVWSLPTLLNQFPLTYYDSGYYIYNAFMFLEAPAKIGWRPLTYSLFLRGGYEMVGWVGFILLQNWVVSGYLLKISRVINEDIKRLAFLIIGLFLSLTPLVFVGNFIMPDIFSVLAILGIICFFATDDFEKKFFFVTAAIFSYMHFSNVFCVIPLLVFYLARNNVKPLLAAILFTVVVLGGRIMFFFPAKSIEETAHYLIYSRLVAFEVTEIYLAQVCPQSDLVFCEDRDKGFNIWGNSGKEFTPDDTVLTSVVRANHDILQSSLFWVYVLRSLQAAGKQLITFTKPMVILLEDKSLYIIIQTYTGADILKYINPKVFNDDIFSLEWMRRGLAALFFFATTISGFFLGWLAYRRKFDVVEQLFLLFFTSAYFLNSLVIGLLSEPLSRYNNKLVWGFTFLLLCFVIPKWTIFNKKKDVTRGGNHPLQPGT